MQSQSGADSSWKSFLKIFMHIQDIINSQVYYNLPYFQVTIVKMVFFLDFIFFRLPYALCGGWLTNLKEV